MIYSEFVEISFFLILFKNTNIILQIQIKVMTNSAVRKTDLVSYCSKYRDLCMTYAKHPAGFRPLNDPYTFYCQSEEYIKN